MMSPPQPSSEQRNYSDRVQVWRGKSGRRYVHAVYPAEACPQITNAVYLAVGRDRSGARRPLAIDGRKAFAAETAGCVPAVPPAEEVHVHLLACCGDAAARVIDDLRAEYGLAAP